MRPNYTYEYTRIPNKAFAIDLESYNCDNNIEVITLI